MLTRTASATVIGIDAYKIDVEVNATGEGEMTQVAVVGLPDTAVRESRDRVKSALLYSGFCHPAGATIVNLAPADLKKEGSAFDLPIALCMLAATGIIDPERLGKIMAVGELALDGTVRPVKGMLPVAVEADSHSNLKVLLVPRANASEAAVAARRAKVYAVNSLTEAVDFINNPAAFSRERPPPESVQSFPPDAADFAEVKGQALAKRGLEIAAAGAHNVLMSGPPGTGKSMTAQRLPSILPEMSFAETIQTSRIHSVMGLLSAGSPLIRTRPFRAPHHTISDAGLIGGGKNPAPGEISLAHNGVLFLDELPEFKRNVLEVLRQPLESGSVNVSRAAGSFTFPADFILVAAMNPCPCGMATPELGCRCTPNEIKRYRGKISGPLLDRIDLHIELLHLSEDELMNAPQSESSQLIKKRVRKARDLQLARFKEYGFFSNSQMESRHIQQFCGLDAASTVLLRNAISSFNLSPRAYDRILKVARTIADLQGVEQIAEEHLFEAVNYRNFDKLVSC